MKLILVIVGSILILSMTIDGSSIQNIQVRENVNVTMTCHFDRNKSMFSTNSLSSMPSSLNQILHHPFSDNIILWYKDDSQVIGVNSISNDPRKYVIHQENFHTYQLTLINVQLESSGIYKCQNFTAKEENRFQLNVMVPPSRLRLSPSPALPVPDGTSVQFNCTSERAYPIPTFEWYKNDQLIQRSIGSNTNNQTSVPTFSSSSLLTLSLSPADHDHILRCQVTNEASIHDTNVELKLDILFKPIINLKWNNKKDLVNDRTLSVIENTFETIHCVISANPSALGNIQWFKNDQLIRGEHQEQLTINFTRHENIQKLTCRAQNPIGYSEATVDVNILYPPKLSMNDRLILNQGEKLLLKCSIDSNPLCHQIRWLHNDKELLTQSCTTAVNQTQTIVEYRIPHVYRVHAGKYTCEVKNWLHQTSSDRRYESTTQISTDVRIQYAPFILNTIKKLAIVENQEIYTECLVDAHPRADITWFGPSGQRLSSFTEEKILNSTVISSRLHLPPSYSSSFGLYRCVARNDFGQHDFSIQFQRPSLPDPPQQLQAVNVTHNSFVLTWKPAFDGGSPLVYHIVMEANHTEERQTSSNSIRFTDLNERSRYIIKIRAKNNQGFSNFTTNFIVLTADSPLPIEQYPIIQQAAYSLDGRRIRVQINSMRSSLISNEKWCLQYYHQPMSNIEIHQELPACVPLTTLQSTNNELELPNNEDQQGPIRLKICLINQTDICSKSTGIPMGVPLTSDSSELILILIGAILGLCVVAGIIGLFVCIQQRRRRNQSKNGSTDTLKANSTVGSALENYHATPVRVIDTNSCLYYPATATINEVRPHGSLFYNGELTNGIYSTQEKKSSVCFDSGMPSTTSNNSDSACSQALSSSDIEAQILHGVYDRADGDQFMHGRFANKKSLLPDIQQLFMNKFQTHSEIPPYTANDILPNFPRISSEEESGFSTPTRSSNQGKKLVYEVVV